jgi:hypothetical protein
MLKYYRLGYNKGYEEKRISEFVSEKAKVSEIDFEKAQEERRNGLQKCGAAM